VGVGEAAFERVTFALQGAAEASGRAAKNLEATWIERLEIR
jgi:hypothetical protein